MTPSPETLALVARLTSANERAAAARALALHVGADDLLLFVRDRDLDAFLPAVGFPKTLAAGGAWRDFLRRCAAGGLTHAEIPSSLPGLTTRVKAELINDVIFAWVGGEPKTDELESLHSIAPLVTAMLREEHRAAAINAAKDAASSACERADALAGSLASSHAELQRTLVSLHSSERLLSMTLASIGDAVISTDALGRILSVNAAAQNLTGWAGDEARGRELREVFQLLDGATRSPMETPVDAVLRERGVVELANHAVLVRRDGREIAVDDSAAPMFDALGELVGVVLVFRDVSERKRVEQSNSQRHRHERLSAAVGEALTTEAKLDEQLGNCTNAVVQQLGVSFARIWTTNERGDLLILRASSGKYTHLDGPHARVPVGAFKIGRIAQEQQPHLTNNVLKDPLVSDSEWARREGMVSFAGYPLVVDKRTVGVLAMFAKTALSDETLAVLGSVASALAVAIERDRKEHLRKAALDALETVNAISTEISSELDTSALVQRVTDVATGLVGAQFGAFFYNVVDARGESYQLFALSGAPREHFERFGMPRNTPLFAPTFAGEGPVRLDDVQQDQRYGQVTPHRGLPPGHLAVRSYLAVPVVSRSGTVHGGLFFGHEHTGVFTALSEQIVMGLAAQAAVAMDNAMLFAAQKKTVEAATARADFEQQLVGIVSHDLRNPLAAVMMAATSLLHGIEDPRVRKGLSRIVSSGERANRMIRDLLDFTQARLGRGIPIKKTEVDLHALVNDVLDENRLARPEREILLSAGGGRLVWCDADRIAQALSNLVDNAVSYSPPSLPVRVAIHSDDEAVVLEVHNGGDPIPPQTMRALFEPMQRGVSQTSARRSVGLGLFIVKHVVEAHGGAVEVRSDATGTVFRVRLPVQRRSTDGEVG